jgi:alpha-tubulin suppressor-like RCC1 family protein
VVLATDGAAWLFGRNGNGALGIPAGPAGDEYISENAPMKLLPVELGAEEGTKFVHAACGRNHTLLVGSDGNVWSAGSQQSWTGDQLVLFLSKFLDTIADTFE